MSSESKVEAEAEADAEAEAEAVALSCASCGTAESDEIKLKICTACKSARYCGVKCQKNHRPHHKKTCKKRAAELREEILFRQPESSHLGDCPICFLPLPLDTNQSVVYSCCCKWICKGCDLANDIRQEEERLKMKCPFCRKKVPETDEECENNEIERAEAGDSVAIRRMGIQYYEEGDYDSAFKYYSRAAEFGDATAHYNLSFLYHLGEGVEKDEERKIYHLEEAAIAGHPSARFSLGIHEWNNERFDRAAKHFIIAASLGHDKSLTEVKNCCKNGYVSKDDLAVTLRAHQAAVDAMKSPQRETIEESAVLEIVKGV